jgi:hypothetical protein
MQRKIEFETLSLGGPGARGARPAAAMVIEGDRDQTIST